MGTDPPEEREEVMQLSVRYEGRQIEIVVTLTPDTIVLSPLQEVDLPALADRIEAILTDYGDLEQPTTSELVEASDCGTEELASLLQLLGEGDAEVSPKEEGGGK